MGADRILGENDEPEGGASSRSHSGANAKAPLAGTRLLRKKYGKLTRELCELVEDFGLVNFATLSIEDKESVTRLVRLTDKCVGYVNAGGFSRATANEAAA